MDHTAIVYLMDKEGHFVTAFNLDRSPQVAAKDLHVISDSAVQLGRDGASGAGSRSRSQ